MPIDFKALETLVWVATLKSFGGAAAKLATTQPAVSQRIAQLEAELGVKLFERAPRRVALTAAGREALAHAERLIAGRAEMIARIADPATTRGVLRLGVAETIVHTWLPDFLAEMARALPRVGLEIEVDTSPALRERLLAQAIDLAFLVGPLSVPEISNAALSSERLAFVASPALGLGRRVDLAHCGHPILTFARNTRPYADLRAAAAAAGIDGLRIHASTSVATIVRMALDGWVWRCCRRRSWSGNWARARSSNSTPGSRCRRSASSRLAPPARRGARAPRRADRRACGGT